MPGLPDFEAPKITPEEARVLDILAVIELALVQLEGMNRDMAFLPEEEVAALSRLRTFMDHYTFPKYYAHLADRLFRLERISGGLIGLVNGLHPVPKADRQNGGGDQNVSDVGDTSHAETVRPEGRTCH